ncbi:MFS family major facilitator transporter [Agrilactobacillus composti DSM 18527 = JCM 14202]|uniref:MFS family major facilitator transporter n=2 Tax=Agrilactobacillus TaxID=2767875 RepID=A0A0R1XRG3_9LACO|nr:MFS family major facilitator transporter [Agrilactobacillus composti DSM 18527 = JCM 14202]
MAIVILAQNMTALSRQWGTSAAGVSFVISSLGIGRLIVLYISGVLSDKYGRKPFVLLGILTYIPFFIGITFSHNMYVAYLFGILAGMANSFLDSGTYPALMELYPENPTTANILIKAFASIGELILPILVTMVEHFDWWFGVSFMVCTIIFAINFFFISRSTFPKLTTVPKPKKDTADEVVKEPLSSNQKVNAIVLTIYGYISMSTFYLVSQWLTKYGQAVLNMNTAHARYLVSIYSVGSIVGVLVSALLTGRLHMRSTNLMLISTFVSFMTLMAISFILTPVVLTVGSFLIGFSAAGGVMQIGLTIMSELFPHRKGLVTGIYYTAGSISSFTIPIITGYLFKISIHSIMVFDCVIAAIGFLLGIIIFFNTKKQAII